VYCFEAQPENSNAIRRNAKSNECDSIHVFQTLLGDREAARLPFTRTGQTGRVASSLTDEGSSESCASTTLDSLVATEELPGPDLVKIDVEGYEAHVLRGMQGILTRFKPTVLMEVHPHLLRQHGESSDEVDRLMASRGYSKTLLRAPGIGTATSHQQCHVAYQHPERKAA
jgi:FkbM family methyltransferase